MPRPLPRQLRHLSLPRPIGRTHRATTDSGKSFIDAPDLIGEKSPPRCFCVRRPKPKVPERQGVWLRGPITGRSPRIIRIRR